MELSRPKAALSSGKMENIEKYFKPVKDMKLSS
jgi:hypothetical protein